MNLLFSVFLSLASLCVILAQRFPADAYFDEKMASMCVSTPTQVRRVLENDFLQLNTCDLPGLKENRIPETRLFLGANVIKGEAEVDAAYSSFCKDREDGGFKGIQFREIQSFIVGNAISVQWVVDAPFLAQPYGGSGAYVTCGNKVLAVISSFNSSELQFK